MWTSWPTIPACPRMCAKSRPLGPGRRRVRGQRPLAAPALRARGPADGRRLRDDRARLPWRSGRARGLGGPGLLQHGLAQRPALRRRRRPRPATRATSRCRGAEPYPIAYRSHRPQAGASARTCWCRSASRRRHIAYGSIRMEPVFMVLGQSAATAAGLALDAGGAVQDVPYASLRDGYWATDRSWSGRAPRRWPTASRSQRAGGLSGSAARGGRGFPAPLPTRRRPPPACRGPLR